MISNDEQISALVEAGVPDEEIVSRLGTSMLEVLGKRAEAASGPTVVRRLRWPRLRNLGRDPGAPMDKS